MSYGDLSSELTGRLQGLSGFLADDFIKRAWRKVRDSYKWSFLIQDDAIVCPAVVNTGTFAITQYNNQVTANAAASAALAALNSVQLPIAVLQIRFGSSTPGGLYNITDYDVTNPAAAVLTLDRVVQETTAAASAYMVYRAYVAAPTADFLRFISVVQQSSGWTLNLDRTSVDFDKWDPQRTSLGQGYYIGFYKPSSDGVTALSPIVPQPMCEIWPGSTQGEVFYVRYRRRGVDFSALGDTQPDMIPDDLIMEMALCSYAYPFAQSNAGHFPAWQKVNWGQLIAQAKRNVYGDRTTGDVGMLQKAKVQDDNQSTQSVWDRGHGLRSAPRYPFPIDAAYMQSHLVPL